MPRIASLPGNIEIRQYYKEHPPAHFHAIQGNDEVLIEIALPLNVLQGSLKPQALADVRAWARLNRAALALN